MTDAARRIQSGEARFDPAAMPSEPAAEAPRATRPAATAARPAPQAGPVRTQARPEPLAETRAESAPQADPAPVQQQLAIPDPSDRVGASSAEDEMLDIPAFLRRQAN